LKILRKTKRPETAKKQFRLEAVSGSLQYTNIMARQISMTSNRIKIIDFAKSRQGTITKAQVMELLSCTEDNAYEQIKSMIKASLLERVEKQKFRLSRNDR
jgi:hypothetical protein